MRIGTRFLLAVHVLLSVEVFKEDRKVTSDFIAKSVNTNPVGIRRIMAFSASRDSSKSPLGQAASG